MVLCVHICFRIAKCILHWVEIAGKELVAETCFKEFVAVSSI